MQLLPKSSFFFVGAQVVGRLEHANGTGARGGGGGDVARERVQVQVGACTQRVRNQGGRLASVRYVYTFCFVRQVAQTRFCGSKAARPLQL